MDPTAIEGGENWLEIDQVALVSVSTSSRFWIFQTKIMRLRPFFICLQSQLPISLVPNPWRSVRNGFLTFYHGVKVAIWRLKPGKFKRAKPSAHRSVKRKIISPFTRWLTSSATYPAFQFIAWPVVTDRKVSHFSGPTGE